MPYIATLEDGTELEFPDNTSRDDIIAATNNYITQNNIQPLSNQPNANAKQPSKNIPRGEAAANTALAGATMGFGDEAVGGITAALLKATGKGGNKSYSQLYREVQQEQQEALQKSREQYPVQSFASEIIPALSTGGAVLKAAKLTEPTLKTLTKGGALLGAIGSAGEAKNLEEVPEKALEQGAIGGALGAIGKVITSPRKTLQEILKVKPEIASTFKETGISPTLGQVSESGLIQRGEAALERLPGAAGQLQKLKEQTIGQIKEGIRNVIPTAARTEQEGGELIQGGAKNYVERFRNVSKKLYNRLDKFVSKKDLINTNNIQSTITDISNNLPTATGARERAANNKVFDIIRDLQKDIKANNGQLPYGDIKYYRSEIGDAIDYTMPSNNLLNANLNKLYGGLSDDMAQAFTDKGKTAKAAFEATNNFYSRGKKQIEDKLTKIINNQYPEKILSEALNGAEKGGTRIRSILRSLEPEEREILKSTIVEKIGQNQEKEFVPSLFLKNYKALSPEARNILFKPDQQAAFTKFNKIIERVRGIEGKANVGNSATQLILTGTGLGALFGLPALAKGVAGAYTAGKLFTSPKFVNWLAQGEKITGEKAIANHFKKLSLIAAANPDIRQEIINLLGDKEE